MLVLGINDIDINMCIDAILIKTPTYSCPDAVYEAELPPRVRGQHLHQSDRGHGNRANSGDLILHISLVCSCINTISDAG